MKTLEQLETKIRQSIPELKEEYEAFEDESIDRDMITPIMLNHVLECLQNFDGHVWSITVYGIFCEISTDAVGFSWDLKSAYLKDQSDELITFLSDLK